MSTCICTTAQPCKGFNRECEFCAAQPVFEDCPAGPESTRKGFVGALTEGLGYAAGKWGQDDIAPV